MFYESLYILMLLLFVYSSLTVIPSLIRAMVFKTCVMNMTSYGVFMWVASFVFLMRHFNVV